jgi:hypothetical protein
MSTPPPAAARSPRVRSIATTGRTRLQSSTVTGAVAGSNTVTDGLAATDITYDARGNTTKFADMTFSYDSANRHVGTTCTTCTAVAIARDALGRVVSRTVDPAGTPAAVTTKNGHADSSDVAWAQQAGSTVPRWITLPGGVTAVMGASGNSYSYPSLQGHTLVTGNGTTTATTGVGLYDPFGLPLHQTPSRSALPPPTTKSKLTALAGTKVP